MHDDRIYTTDLCVDLLVGANGKDYRIKDIDMFEKMHSMNHFGDVWFEKARSEITSLVRLLESGKFIDYLNDAAPFPITPIENKSSPMRQCDVADVVFEHHPLYHRTSKSVFRDHR